MHVPSVAAWYACGRFAATPYRRCNPSSSNRKIEHNIPSLWASIRRVILVRTSIRAAPMSIIFSASSTASLGRVCAGDEDLDSARMLSNALALAIYQPPTTYSRVSCSVKLFRVLRLTVAKRPVLFADFYQTNEHVLPAQAETLVQSVCDCFIKGTFLIHGSPSIERDLDKNAIF